MRLFIPSYRIFKNGFCINTQKAQRHPPHFSHIATPSDKLNHGAVSSYHLFPHSMVFRSWPRISDACLGRHEDRPSRTNHIELAAHSFNHCASTLKLTLPWSCLSVYIGIFLMVSLRSNVSITTHCSEVEWWSNTACEEPQAAKVNKNEMSNRIVWQN